MSSVSSVNPSNSIVTNPPSVAGQASRPIATLNTTGDTISSGGAPAALMRSKRPSVGTVCSKGLSAFFAIPIIAITGVLVVVTTPFEFLYNKLCASKPKLTPEQRDRNWSITGLKIVINGTIKSMDTANQPRFRESLANFEMPALNLITTTSIAMLIAKEEKKGVFEDSFKFAEHFFDYILCRKPEGLSIMKVMEPYRHFMEHYNSVYIDLSCPRDKESFHKFDTFRRMVPNQSTEAVQLLTEIRGLSTRMLNDQSHPQYRHLLQEAITIYLRENP